MTRKVQYVFRIEPYRILLDLGVPVTQENGRFFVPHPKDPKARMLLDGRSLVSSSLTCDVVACSLFEYIRLQLGSYSATLDFLIERYHQNAQATPGTSLAALKPAFIEDLKGERKDFEAVLKLRNRMLENENLLDSFLWCRRRGISVKHGWRSFYLARRADLIPFMDSDDTRDVKLEDEHYLVFPYLVDPHTYGWLKVQSATTKTNFTIPLQKTSHAFYGLHTCLPSVSEIRVYADPVVAQLAYSSEVEMINESLGCVHVGHMGVSDTNSYKIDEAVFVQTSGANFGQMAQARTAINKMRVSSASAEDPTLECLLDRSVTWTAHVLSETDRLIQAEGVESAEFRSLLDVIRTDRDLCGVLLRRIEKQQTPEIVARIRQHLNANQTYSIGGMEIIETPNGYVAKRKNTSVPFTNFTIRIDQNVHFEGDETDTIHCGRVIMHGQEFPIVIPNRIMDRKPADIPGICLTSIVKAGMGDQAGFFPQIVDSTLSRRLGEVLKQQAEPKGTCHGVRRLGWNDERSRFTTPCWAMTVRGEAPTSRIPYPFSNFLQAHYDFREYSYVPGKDLVTPHVNTFICMIASGLVRSFLHLMVPPVAIMRNPASIDLLHALFRPFGQSTAIPFGAQRRVIQNVLSKENLAGYPVFGIAANSEMVSGTSYPIFLIADNGVPFHEGMTDEVYVEVAGYAKSIYAGILSQCLRNPTQMHLLIPSEDEPQIKDMIREGKRIVEHCLGIPSFSIFESQMPLFEMMLGNVPVDQVGDFFRYDMPTNCIYIKMRKFSSFSRREVVDELASKNSEVHLHGDHYISCPADFLFEVMASFYGKPVKLFHQNPEPEPTEPFEAAQDDSAQSAP